MLQNANAQASHYVHDRRIHLHFQRNFVPGPYDRHRPRPSEHDPLQTKLGSVRTSKGVVSGVHVEPFGHTRVIRLAKANSHNMLDGETCRKLIKLLLNMEENPAVKAVVLKGRDQQLFTAGTDFADLHTRVVEAQKAGLPPTKAMEVARLDYVLQWLVHTYTKPLVVGTHGVTGSAGFALAANSKFGYATPSTQVVLPEVSMGLVPGSGLTYTLSRTRGGVGMYMALTGAPMRGDELAASGLLSYQTTHELLEAEAPQAMSHAAAGSPLAPFELEKDIHFRNAQAERRENYMELKSDLIDEQTAELDVDQVERYKRLQMWRTLGKLGRKDLADKVLKATDDEPVLAHEMAPAGVDWEDGEAEAFFMEGHENSAIHGVNDHNEPIAVTMQTIGDFAGVLPHQLAHSEHRTMEEGKVPDAVKAKLAAIERTFGGVPGLGDPVMTVSDRTLPFRGGGSMLRPPTDTVREAREAQAAKELRAKLAVTEGPEALTGEARDAAQAKLDLLEQHPYAKDPWRRLRSSYWLARLEATGSLSAPLPANWASEAALGQSLEKLVLNACYEVNETRPRSGDKLRTAVEKLVPAAWPHGWASEEEVARVCDEAGLLPDTAPHSTASAALPDHPAAFEAPAASDEHRHGREAVRVAASMAVARLHKVPPLSLVPEEAAVARRALQEQQRLANAKMRSVASSEPDSLRWRLERILRNPMNRGTTAHPSHGGQATAVATAKLAPAAELSAAALEALYSPAGAPSTVPGLADKLRSAADFRNGLSALAGQPGAAGSPLAMAFPAAIATLRAQAAAASSAAGSGGELLVGSAKDALAWLEEAGADLDAVASTTAAEQQAVAASAPAEDLAALGRRLAALADPAAALQEAREFALAHVQANGRSGTLEALQEAGFAERVHPKVLSRLAEAQEAQSGTPALADEPASSGRLMGEFRLEGLGEVGRQLVRPEVRSLLTSEEVEGLAAARAALRRVEAEAPAGGALPSEQAEAQRALGAALLRPAQRMAQAAAVPASRMRAASDKAVASAEQQAAAVAAEAQAAAGAATPTEVAGLKALGGDAKSVAVDAAPAGAGFVSSEGLLPRLKSVVEEKAKEAKALVSARRDALRVEAMWAAAARAALPASEAATASAVARQVAQLKAAAGGSAVPPQPEDAEAVTALAEAAASADPMLSDAAIAEAVGLWPALEASILEASQRGAKATEDERVRVRAGTRAAAAASRAQQLGEHSAVPLERTVSQLTTDAAGQSVAAALMARAAFGRLMAEGAAAPAVDSAAAELTAAARRFVASRDPLTPAEEAASTSWLSGADGEAVAADQVVALPAEMTLGAYEGTPEEEAAVRRLADRRGVSSFASSVRDSLQPEALQERLPAGVKYVPAQPGRFDPAEVLDGEKSILDPRDSGAMSALSDPELAKGVQRVIREGRTRARQRMGLVGAAGAERLPEHPYEATEEPIDGFLAMARDMERDTGAWASELGVEQEAAAGSKAGDLLFGAEADGWAAKQVAVDGGAAGAEAATSGATGLATDAARRATSLRSPTAYGYSWQRDTSTHGAAATDPRGLTASQRPTDELVMRDLARSAAHWQERAILGGRREASALHRALDRLEAAADSAARAAGDEAAIALAGFDQAVLDRYLTGRDVTQRSRLGADSGSRYPSLEASDSAILQASAALRSGSDSLGASALDSVDLAAYRPALRHEVEVASAAEVDPEAFVDEQVRGAWHERQATPAPRADGEAHTSGPLVSGGASTTGSSVPDQAALRLARGDADAARRAAANAAADPTVSAEATAVLVEEARRQATRVADLERLADPSRPLTAREQWVADLLTASPARAEALASLGWQADDLARSLSVKAAASGRSLDEAAPAASPAEVADKAAAALASQAEATSAAERLAAALEAARVEAHPLVEAVAAAAAAPAGSTEAAAALASVEAAVGDAAAARVLCDTLAGDSAAAEAALAGAQPALLQQLAVATRRVHSLASSRLAAMVPGGWREGLAGAVGEAARTGQSVRRQLDRMRRGVEPAIGGVARQEDKASAAVARAEKKSDASVVAAAEEAAAAAAAAAGGQAASGASSRLDRLLADLAAKPAAKKAAGAKGKKASAKAAETKAAAAAAAEEAPKQEALWSAVDARLPPQMRSPALRRLALLDPSRARELVRQEAAGAVDPALAAEVAARAVGEWSRAAVEAAEAAAGAATEAQLDAMLSALGPKLAQLRQAGAEGLLADMYRARGAYEVSEAAGVVSGVSASVPWSGPTLSAGAAAHVSARSLGLLAADQELLQPAGMHDPEATEHPDVSRLVVQQRVDAENAVQDVDPRLDEAGWLDDAEQPAYTTVGGLRVPVRPWQWRDRDVPTPTDAEMAQITHDPRALMDALRFPDRVPPPVQRAAVEATLRFQDIDAWRMSVPQARSVEEIKRRLRAEDTPFARRALRQLESNPALAVGVAHRLIAEGSRYTLAECMAAEFRANARLAGHSDFAERGGLLARGTAPSSVPPVLSEEPTAEEVAELLAPLDDPEAELVLARRFHLHHQRQLHAEESAWMDEEMERMRSGEGAGAAGAFYRRRFHWVYDPDGSIRGAHSRFEESAHDPEKVSDWQLKPAHEVQADTAKGLPVRDGEKEEQRAVGRYMRRLEEEAGTQLHTKAARALDQPAPMSEATAAELRERDPAAWAQRHLELAMFNAEAAASEDPNHRHSARLRVEQDSMDEDEVKFWDVKDARTLYPNGATEPAALAASIRAAGGSARDALRGLSDASDAQAKTAARERVAGGIAKVHELRAAQLRMQALQAEAAAEEAARHSRRFERPRSQQRSRQRSNNPRQQDK